jgi:hypothetical protein
MFKLRKEKEVNMPITSHLLCHVDQLMNNGLEKHGYHYQKSLKMIVTSSLAHKSNLFLILSLVTLIHQNDLINIKEE